MISSVRPWFCVFVGLLATAGCAADSDTGSFRSPAGKADEPALCCDAADEPGTGDNPTCFEGATCCDDGSWQCNEGGGESTCAAAGEVCEPEPACCDAADEPGTGDNPTCFEGATCCDDGSWQCNEGGGESTCAAAGEVCEPEPACCDAADEPGTGGNPFCFEGATCCDDGSWQCNEGGGESTCAATGYVCEAGA